MKGGGGGTSYLCGFLNPGVEGAEIPCDRLSSSSAYRETAEGIFHVNTLFLTDSGGEKGEGYVASL